MDRTEEFARQWEQFDQLNTHLAAWELAWHRQHHADTYRRLVGVSPSQREPLRESLQEIVRSGRGSVEAAIESVRTQAAEILGERPQSDKGR
jgi:hypothetical protein